MVTIIGLENAGGRKRFCRHALGARFLDFIHEQGDFSEWKQKEDIEYSYGTLSQQPLRLMRLVKGTLNTCGHHFVPHLLDCVDQKEIIVVHDETGMEISDCNFISGIERDNGHLGVRSMIQELRTAQFARGEIGIGSLPKSRDELPEFFDGDLTKEEQELIQSTFPRLLSEIMEYSAGLKNGYHKDVDQHISEEMRLKAQVPGRARNLWIFPQPILMYRKDVRELDNAVNVLVGIITRTANRYARMCRKDSNDELVYTLESGIPEQMVSFVRNQAFHVENVSFDFQLGKLIEINPGPLPIFPTHQLREMLNKEGPGVAFTPEELCERVLRYVRYFRNQGKQGKIKILPHVAGGAAAGDGGWIVAVKKYLEEKECVVCVGKRELNDDIIWANVTWMTPERWSDVLGDLRYTDDVRIFPSPRNFLFTSKKFLSILSSTTGRKLLKVSPNESAVLDNVIPWTQEITEERSFIKYLLRNEQRLYAKPFLGSGGIGGREIKRMADLKKVEFPAIIQEWVEPYRLGEYSYDIRVTLSGSQGDKRSWLARVWSGEKLQRPMMGVVIYK